MRLINPDDIMKNIIEKPDERWNLLKDFCEDGGGERCCKDSCEVVNDDSGGDGDEGGSEDGDTVEWLILRGFVTERWRQLAFFIWLMVEILLRANF